MNWSRVKSGVGFQVPDYLTMKMHADYTLMVIDTCLLMLCDSHSFALSSWHLVGSQRGMEILRNSIRRCVTRFRAKSDHVRSNGRTLRAESECFSQTNNCAKCVAYQKHSDTKGPILRSHEIYSFETCLAKQSAGVRSMYSEGAMINRM
jgi:hypothetical protein